MKREAPRRRDTRLAGWDYRLPGPYAITICTEHRVCRFGRMVEGQMVLNDAGAMVTEIWENLLVHFPTVTLDAHVVMPNHVHAILFLDYGDGPARPNLGAVVQRFKTVTTALYARGVHDARWAPFDGRLWQRNFYDHIVRDDRDLDRCRRYIEANPGQWQEDQDYMDDDPIGGDGPIIS